MSDLLAFLKWLIQYAVEGTDVTAPIHFFAVVIIVNVITRFTSLVIVDFSRKSEKSKKDEA